MKIMLDDLREVLVPPVLGFGSLLELLIIKRRNPCSSRWCLRFVCFEEVPYVDDPSHLKFKIVKINGEVSLVKRIKK